MNYNIRVASANGYYHVMSRGNNKYPIFNTSKDKNVLLNQFEKIGELEGFDILAYCIMPNHYHLLTRSESIEVLSNCMQRINFSYSKYYRFENDYVGHVFQGRFISCCINSREYLYRAIRYIHQNPVKAKLCRDAIDYYHSSYCEYVGRYTRNILPENGLLLLEELGFNDVISFRKFHLEVSSDDLDGMLLDDDFLSFEDKPSIRNLEMEEALSMKETYGDYSLLNSHQRLHFANSLLDSTTMLSKSAISRIAEIDRHRLG